MNEGGARPVNRQGGVEGEVAQVPVCEIRDTGISIIHANMLVEDCGHLENSNQS